MFPERAPPSYAGILGLLRGVGLGLNGPCDPNVFEGTLHLRHIPQETARDEALFMLSIALAPIPLSIWPVPGVHPIMRLGSGAMTNRWGVDQSVLLLVRAGIELYSPPGLRKSSLRGASGPLECQLTVISKIPRNEHVSSYRPV